MSIEERELICIGCPSGCPVRVRLEGEKILSIDGYTCPRGKIYAEKEVLSPTRIVTSIVPVVGGETPMVSVKTASDIPKSEIFKCMETLRGVSVKAPVKIGDVIVKNAAGTGIDIIATKNVDVCAQTKSGKSS